MVHAMYTEKKQNDNWERARDIPTEKSKETMITNTKSNLSFKL